MKLLNKIKKINIILIIFTVTSNFIYAKNSQATTQVYKALESSSNKSSKNKISTVNELEIEKLTDNIVKDLENIEVEQTNNFNSSTNSNNSINYKTNIIEENNNNSYIKSSKSKNILQNLILNTLKSTASIKVLKNQSYFTNDYIKLDETKFFNKFLKSDLFDNDILKKTVLTTGSGVFINMEQILYNNFFHNLTNKNLSAILHDLYLNHKANSSTKECNSTSKYYLITNYHIVDNYQDITIKLHDSSYIAGQDLEDVSSDIKKTTQINTSKELKQNQAININSLDKTSNNSNLSLLHSSDAISSKVYLYATNKDLDLAVLRYHVISDFKLNIIPINLDKQITLGEDVILISSPLGLDFSASKGIISYKDRIIQNSSTASNANSPKYLQIDSLISSGSSGGGIFNYDNKLVGLISGLFAHKTLDTGIAFAISASDIESFLINNEDYIIEFGLNVNNFFDDNLVQKELNSTNNANIKTENIKQLIGVKIENIEKNSIAEKIGLFNSDIIISVNDILIFDKSFLNFALFESKENNKIKINCIRNNKEIKIETQLPKSLEGDFIEFQGIKFTEITNALLKKYGFKDRNISGIIITKVKKDNNLDLLSEGDIISQVNNQKVENLQDLNNIFKKINKDNIDISFSIKKPNATNFISFSHKIYRANSQSNNDKLVNNSDNEASSLNNSIEIKHQEAIDQEETNVTSKDKDLNEKNINENEKKINTNKEEINSKQ